MEIKTGYIYHIKDEFFKIINDENLMANHEQGRKRPTYFTIKDGEILWFIPLSSKVDKYRRVVNRKIQKYGFCNTIIIETIFEKEHAILLQNAFPTLEKYIDHVHMINGAEAKVPTNLKKKILSNFKSMMRMKERGIDLFFADIDKIKLQLLEEIKNPPKIGV